MSAVLRLSVTVPAHTHTHNESLKMVTLWVEGLCILTFLQSGAKCSKGIAYSFCNLGWRERRKFYVKRSTRWTGKCGPHSGSVSHGRSEAPTLATGMNLENTRPQETKYLTMPYCEMCRTVKPREGVIHGRQAGDGAGLLSEGGEPPEPDSDDGHTVLRTG